MRSRLLLSSTLRSRPLVNGSGSKLCTRASRTHQAYLHNYQQHPTETREGQLISRVSGPTDKPLNELSLPEFWSQIVSQYADRQALISRHEPASQHSSSTKQTLGNDCLRWTFGEFNQHISELVSGLLDLGVRKGDRVGVLMMNCSAYGALQWAASEIGAVLVLLNPAYSPVELKRAINLVGISTLVTVPSLRGSNYLESLHELMPSLSSATAATGDRTLLQDENLPSLKRVVMVDNLSDRPSRWESSSVLAQQNKSFAEAMDLLNGRAVHYRDLLGSSKSKPSEKVLNSDVINLQLTSGTTGKPKAVALTSRNLLNNGIAIGDTLKFAPHDVLCNVPPLFHCFGLVLGNLAAWTHGASVVYAAEGFDAVRSLRAASEEKCTAMHGVPTHFIAELEVLQSMQEHLQDQEKYPLPAGVFEGEKFEFSLRTGLTSGSTVPIALMKSLMDPAKLGATGQTVVYGQTETSPVTFGCDVDASVVNRCETVGRVYPHVHAKIVSPDDKDGKPLPIGQAGELCTGGYITMHGYWNDAERTREALQVHPDEPEITWMRTGDLGTMDKHGYVRIVGRAKDVIIRGGENLFPVNIENSIDCMEGVATNAVIAVPDEKYGEAVGVFVARSHTNQDASPSAIRSHVKKYVGGQSAPVWVWYLGEDGIAAEFPKTASGKIQKVVLREWAKDLAAKGQGKVNHNA